MRIVEKNVPFLINNFRKGLLKELKLGKIKYKYDSTCSLAYRGDQFYVNNRELVKTPLQIWGWDKHWAFGSILAQRKVPLSSVLDYKETELGIFAIKFKGDLTLRYPEFNYNIFANEDNWLDINFKDGYHYMLLSNLDYEILSDMYTNDFQVINKLYFQDIGYLPDNVKNHVEQLYRNKQSWKQLPNQTEANLLKTALEAGIYGMNAKKLKDCGFDNSKDEKVKAYAESGLKNPRNKEVPLAMFQAAYNRYDEWQLFKKYKDNVVYMNGDSIYCNKDIGLPDGKNLGEYGVCYNGEHIYFIRRNVYVVIDQDCNPIEWTIGGAVDPIVKKEDIVKWSKGDPVQFKSYADKFHTKEVEIDIYPYFNPLCKYKKN